MSIPTLFDALELESPAVFQGESLLPLFDSPGEPRTRFCESMFYGDVITTGDFRGTNAVLVGQIDGKLGVLATKVRVDEYTTTPPPSMCYPTKVRALDYWRQDLVGPIPLGFPNSDARRRAVKLHDLHHVLTGYGTTWTGVSTFSQSLVVTAVGAYAGNIGLKGSPASAYTGNIDLNNMLKMKKLKMKKNRI